MESRSRAIPFSANPQYNILEVKKRTIQMGGVLLSQIGWIVSESVWRFSPKWTKISKF